MDDAEVSAAPRLENLPETRALVVPFVVLAGTGAIVLYGFPGRTDELFAWALTPPASALMMGAGYAAGVVLTVLSFPRHTWAVTRLAALTIFVFVVVMTLTTLLHLDKMHFATGPVTARFAAWAWLAVYVVITPALAVVLMRQWRQRGVDPPRLLLLPPPLRWALGAQSLALAAIGSALLIVPERMDAVWPWPITALSGRALAAWVLAIGFASGWAVVEDDLRRTWPAAVTFVIFGALLLLGVVRSGADMRWERPAAWIYVLAAAGALAVGAWGWRLAASAGSEPGPAG